MTGRHKKDYNKEMREGQTEIETDAADQLSAHTHTDTHTCHKNHHQHQH